MKLDFHALILGLILGLSPATHARTGLCPNPNTLTGRPDPGHFHLITGDEDKDAVPLPCNSCEDPNNAEFSACRIYQFLHSPACKGRNCKDDQGIFKLHRTFKNPFGLQYDTRHLDPTRYPRASGENCRFLIWALQPSIGVEDIQTRTRHPYWELAFRASQHWVRPAFPRREVGVVIQSALTRGQHQLHLHIGRLYPDYRRAIDTLQERPRVTQRVIIRDYLFYAKYIPNAPGKGPFTGANPFDVASAMIPEGAPGIPEYGVLATMAPHRKGIFVLTAKGLDRDQLNFHSDKACRMIFPGESEKTFKE